MPSKMILLLGVPMFVGCCTILWHYWDRFKKPPNPHHKKKIFISADCWLKVFDLLPRSQLGFGIALISSRFDFYVDEHFKTRKWTLGQIVIQRKIGVNGAIEMEIVTSDGLPILQNALPNKLIGFRSIFITYFDHNVLTFLGRFHRFFATSATHLAFMTENVRILEFVVLNILPMLKETIREMDLNTVAFRQMRQTVPSILNDCPALRVVNFIDGILPEFPPDESANASVGQAVAKWLFSPRPDNLPKELKISIDNSSVDQWSATVEHIKATFSNASSPVSFVIGVSFGIDVVPFKLTNEFTGEQLTMSQEYFSSLYALKLIRRPIEKATHKLNNGDNQIGILIGDDEVDNGLLDASSAGLSGDH